MGWIARSNFLSIIQSRERQDTGIIRYSAPVPYYTLKNVRNSKKTVLYRKKRKSTALLVVVLSEIGIPPCCANYPKLLYRVAEGWLSVHRVLPRSEEHTSELQSRV